MTHDTKGTHVSSRQHAAKKPAQGTGIFAALAGLLPGRGSGAPARPSDPVSGPDSLRATLIAAALVLFALALPAAASAAPPTFSIDPVAQHSITTAKASGTITIPSEADGGYEGYWFFQYCEDASPGSCTETSHWEYGPERFAHTLPAGATAAPVTETLTNLHANTEYTLRLTVIELNNYTVEIHSDESTYKSFKTDPAPITPSGSVSPATGITYTTANIAGSLDPEGGNEEPDGSFVPLHWSLELESASTPGEFESRASGNVTGTQAGEDFAPGSGIELGPVNLTGLMGGHTYHYRLGVTYAGQKAFSELREFTTVAVAKPVITGLAASEITGTTAHLSAEIDAGTNLDPAFAVSYHFECVPGCSGNLFGSLAPGEAKEVQATAKGLVPNATYTLRLVASNAGGARKATTTFSTPGAAPQIIPFDAGPLTATTAGINAEIDPNGSSTSYYFEWGTEDCSTGSCQTIPSNHEADAGSSPYFTYVDHTLTGLQPETTYHFRVVAKNSFGTASGPDREFTTPAPEPPCTNKGEPGTDFLPDCRGWEMVSPTEKDGGGVIPQTDKTYVAPDGNAVTFSSLSAFGDLEGSAVDFEYLAHRTATPGTNGWTTHGVNPTGRPVTFGSFLHGNAGYFDAFSSDLSSALYTTWRPLVPGSNVEEVNNIYRVDGLDTDTRTPTLLTDSPTPLPAGWFGPPLKGAFAGLIHPRLVGTTSDLSSIVFQSQLDLTADAPPYEGFCALGGLGCQTKLYENEEGAITLLGRIPSSGTECDDSPKSPHPCVAAQSSAAALDPYYHYSERAVSADARRVYFVTTNGLSSGAIYLREDGVRTFRVAQNATFWDASRDGSRAFLITEEQLTEEDNDGSPDIYMYDREAPKGQRYTLITVTPPGEPGGYADTMMGASADGHTLYFQFDEPLSAGQPSGYRNLYRWHDGQVSFIGSLESSLEDDSFRTDFSNGKNSRIDGSGRYLLFREYGGGLAGRGGFPGYPSEGHTELFLYDSATGRLNCATCNPSGASPVGPGSALLSVRTDAGGSPALAAVVPHALTDDGRYVFFSSSDRLVPDDTNGYYDAYEYDSVTGKVQLLSSGTEESNSYFIGANPDGHDVYFVTRQQLVGWDHDHSYDMYDARVDGGFPEPPPVIAPCAADACRHASPPAPPEPPVATNAPLSGNPKPKTTTCPKGRHAVKRHGKRRCVKPKRAHKNRRTHR